MDVYSNNPLFKSVDEVYCSNSSRAYETALYVLPEKKPIITPLLSERSLGIFEGKFIDEIKADPEYSKYFNDDNFKDFRHSFTTKAPNGENYADVLERISIFFSKFDFNDEKTICIFSHMCTIRCILMYLLNLKEEETLRIRVPNCSPIIVEQDSNKRFVLTEPRLEMIM